MTDDSPTIDEPSHPTRTGQALGELKDLFTGPRTVGDSIIPPLVFAVANAIGGIPAAVIASLTVGAGFVAYRVRKGRPIIYALGGLAAVGFALALAVRSGRAETFFLPGIISQAAYAVLAVVSIAVRRPMTAWMSYMFRGWPLPWFWRNDVRPAYTETTWLWAVYFSARAGGQWYLFNEGRTALLATFKVATSWPILVFVLVGTYVYGNWRLHRLGGPNVEEFKAGTEPPFAGGQVGF
ncbi:MAG: DUF3159 domain-containing protein [Acidimicrobiia bacterium]|nr:DUF3159 domain-containing protein [Acidimicrobiia bacterium]